MKPVLTDLAGKRFGLLTAIEPTKERDSQKKTLWLCKCDCGKTKLTTRRRLLNGFTRSCGCLIGKANRRHGEARSTFYDVWASMKARCSNPDHHAYHNYGARGIKVCERWESFENFAADMGPRPEGMTLERKDNNGNYEPGNCEWATRKRQSNNTRRTVRIEFRGETKSIAEWADQFSLHTKTVRGRLRRGWSVEDALTIPASTPRRLT